MLVEIAQQFLSLGVYDWLILILGVCIGFVFGFLPGLGGTQAIALLLPATFVMSPERAMLLLLGIAGAVAFAGSASAILLNTPGTAVSVATAWDGNALARSGRAGEALGASATASGLGALLGVVVLLSILPFGEELVLAFSYADYFALALMGLCLLVVMESRSLWKGFMSLALGLLLASVGYDPVTGRVRYTFGVDYLWDGVGLIPAVIGLFAVAEGLRLVINEADPTARQGERPLGASYGDVLRGVGAVFRHFRIFLQSSLIGVIIGIVPGVGGSVSNLLAYSAATQTTRGASQYGRGDIRGVIAPEAANDSKDGGGLVPTLLFGIPGTAEFAVLLGALMLHGVTPGYGIMSESPGVVYAIVIALVVSNILVSLGGILAAPVLSRIPSIRASTLGAAILVLALIGSYATHGSYNDVVMTLVIGSGAYFMSRYGFSRVAIIMALVLGQLMQQNLFRTLDVAGPMGFFKRPISLTLILISALTLLAAAGGFSRLRRLRLLRLLGRPGPGVGGRPATKPRPDQGWPPLRRQANARHIGPVVFSLVLVAIATVFLVGGLWMPWRPRFFPFVFSVILLVMGVVQTLADLMPEHPWLRFVRRQGVELGPAPGGSRHDDAAGQAAAAQQAGHGAVAQDSAPGAAAQAPVPLVLLMLVLFFVLFRLVSVYLAVPVLVVALVWWLRRGSLWRALTLAALANVFVWAIFGWFLQRDL